MTARSTRDGGALLSGRTPHPAGSSCTAEASRSNGVWGVCPPRLQDSAVWRALGVRSLLPPPSSRRIPSHHPIPNTTAALHTGPSPLCSALPTPRTPRHEGSVSMCSGEPVAMRRRLWLPRWEPVPTASEPRHSRRPRPATNGFQLQAG